MSVLNLASLRDALRERLTLRAALTWIALFGLLRVVLDASVEQLATTLVTAAVVGVGDVVSDAYDLRSSVEHAWAGVTAVVGGTALLALDDGATGLPAMFLAVGGWFVLDAVQTARHEGATVPETTRDGHDVYRDYVARRVHETVKERPRTRRELADALDADEASRDAAVERLLDRGVLERAGSELRVASTPDPGYLESARRRATALARRIARPVTLEFEGGDGEGERDEGRSHVDRVGDHAEREPVTDGTTSDGAAGERGRERATEE